MSGYEEQTTGLPEVYKLVRHRSFCKGRLINEIQYEGFRTSRKPWPGTPDYPTYSDGGTPNCFLKEVEKWERVLKPVM